MVLSWGRFCFLQDIWQCFETFLAFITGGALLYLVGSGQRIWFKMYIVPRLRNHARESATWKWALREGTWPPRITRLLWGLLTPYAVSLCIFIAGVVAAQCISTLLAPGSWQVFGECCASFSAGRPGSHLQNLEVPALPPSFLSSLSVYFLVVICKAQCHMCISFFLHNAPDPKLPFLSSVPFIKNLSQF